VMKRDKAKIKWEYEETNLGGRVVARTGDAGARDAIHEFLRFQIEEHRTGNSEEESEEE
jgi:hypothetical protein